MYSIRYEIEQTTDTFKRYSPIFILIYNSKTRSIEARSSQRKATRANLVKEMEDPNIDSQPQPSQPAQPPYLKFLEEKKKPIIFVIFVVIILLLVIFTTREPEATVQWIRVKEVTSTFITFEITLDVENGNIVGGTLNYLEADIFYNDEPIGHARTIGKYEIKAMGTSTLKVDLTINNLPSRITLFPKIRAEGTANISIFFLTFDKEIDETVRL